VEESRGGLHRRVVVRRDVRFEEDRAIRRSLELRDKIEEVPQIQSDASQGTQPQVSSTPSSGVTGPLGTVSGSQLPSIQIVGVGASGSQTTLQRSVHETQGHEETTPQRLLQGRRNRDGFRRLLRFGYLGKWSPCVCESLNTKGEIFDPHLLLYVIKSL
jgi:hypothetical protein